MQQDARLAQTHSSAGALRCQRSRVGLPGLLRPGICQCDRLSLPRVVATKAAFLSDCITELQTLNPKTRTRARRRESAADLQAGAGEQAGRHPSPAAAVRRGAGAGRRQDVRAAAAACQASAGWARGRGRRTRRPRRWCTGSCRRSEQPSQEAELQ